MARCYCPDWKANIELLDGPIVQHAIRTGTKGYGGKPFLFCPWCGAELQSTLTEPEAMDDDLS